MIAHPFPIKPGVASRLPEPLNRSRQSRRFPPVSFIAMVLLFAFALRIAASGGSLWLDEIWSLELANQAQNTAAIFTELHTDNNHPLNTLYLRALGTNRSAFVYRLPAVVFGTASVGLGTWIAARWGRIEAVAASTLLASSYLLIHYSSEARGYSLAIFCALAAWESLLRYIDSPRWMWIASFWLSCFWGPLAHPIFVHFLLAAACWSALSVSSCATTWKVAVRHGIVLFGVPFAFTGAMYGYLWRHLDLGGGPAYTLTEIVTQTASLSLGGPSLGFGAVVVALLVLACCFAVYWRLGTDRHSMGMFLIFALAMPIVHAAVTRPPFLFPRYFLMSAIMVPFAVSLVCGAVYRFPRFGKQAYAILLLTFIGANLFWTVRLVTVGRGQYLAALQYLADQTDDSVITISSDHNFGVRKLIEFYSRHLPPHKPIEYIDGNRWTAAGPRWLVLHRHAESAAPPPESQQLIDGHLFRLEKMFDCTILSGWQWWCYRRQ